MVLLLQPVVDLTLASVYLIEGERECLILSIVSLYARWKD